VMPNATTPAKERSGASSLIGKLARASSSFERAASRSARQRRADLEEPCRFLAKLSHWSRRLVLEGRPLVDEPRDRSRSASRSRRPARPRAPRLAGRAPPSRSPAVRSPRAGYAGRRCGGSGRPSKTRRAVVRSTSSECFEQVRRRRRKARVERQPASGLRKSSTRSTTPVPTP
jgi:hypothetical protein